jgi:hypothetical protein
VEFFMQDLNFLLQRYSDNGNSTQGLFFEKIDLSGIDMQTLEWFSHTLEDEYRAEKVKGETRIPGGKVYELKIRQEDTPLTIKHRETYNKGEAEPWFEYHIEITGIENFFGCYIHSGISEKHTDGCLLLCDTANNHKIETGDMARSLQAVKRFYQKVYPHLKKGGRAFLEVRDENCLK